MEINAKNKSERLVKKLSAQKKTVSCMESCTGGGLANEITNIEGSSGVIKFSAVTYSNEYKVKMGVSKDAIDKYTVYSAEVARQMSKSISEFADSDYGVGITGKLNRADENNDSGADDIVFICVYERAKNLFYEDVIRVNRQTRPENKQIVINKALDILINNM